VVLMQPADRTLAARFVALRRALDESDEARLLCEEQLAADRIGAGGKQQPLKQGRPNTAVAAAASRAAEADVRLLVALTAAGAGGNSDSNADDTARDIAGAIAAAPSALTRLLTESHDVRVGATTGVATSTVKSAALVVQTLVDGCAHTNPDVAAAAMDACRAVCGGLQQGMAPTLDAGEDEDAGVDPADEAADEAAAVLAAALVQRGLLQEILQKVDVATSASASAASEDSAKVVVAGTLLLRQFLSATPVPLAVVADTLCALGRWLQWSLEQHASATLGEVAAGDEENVWADPELPRSCVEECADAVAAIAADFGLVMLSAKADAAGKPAVVRIAAACLSAAVAIANTPTAFVVMGANEDDDDASAAGAALSSVVALATDIVDVADAALLSAAAAVCSASVQDWCGPVMAAFGAATRAQATVAARVAAWEALSVVLQLLLSAAAAASPPPSSGAPIVTQHAVVAALFDARLPAVIGPVADSAVAGVQVAGKRRRDADDADSDEHETSGIVTRMRDALVRTVAALIVLAEPASQLPRLRTKLMSPCSVTSGSALVSRADALLMARGPDAGSAPSAVARHEAVLRQCLQSCRIG
jgi:hypothetical protein